MKRNIDTTSKAWRSQQARKLRCATRRVVGVEEKGLFYAIANRSVCDAGKNLP